MIITVLQYHTELKIRAAKGKVEVFLKYVLEQEKIAQKIEI